MAEIVIDSDSETSLYAAGSSIPAKKRQKQDVSLGGYFLHTKETKSWKQRLVERGIREYQDPDRGRLQKSAQYLSGMRLTAEDEEWWLRNTPRRQSVVRNDWLLLGMTAFWTDNLQSAARVISSRTKERSDRPPCLTEASVGDDVLVFDGKQALKGTVVRAESDSEGDSDEHQLKYNRVPVKFKGQTREYTRVRRSRMRNRTVHLDNLPVSWEGRIRLSSKRSKFKGRLHLSSPHSSTLEAPLEPRAEELRLFLEHPNISAEDREEVETSLHNATRAAKRVWPWLVELDRSDGSSVEDYNGDFCAVCGEGGTLVECHAKGCVESVHLVCLKSELDVDQAWFCESCRQEAFLCNRTVETQVKHGAAMAYLDRIFGKPPLGGGSDMSRVCFELPKFIDPPQQFGIGVICGSSGSGKSQILARRFRPCQEAEAKWDPDEAIAAQVHSDPSEAVERLIAAAIESESDMRKPYHALSEGQRMRARVARALDNDVIIDEFASCLDYAIVHSLCRGVSRFVRANNLSKVIVASCHPMVVEWIRPDWSYNTDTRIMRHHSEHEWPPRQPHSVTRVDETVRAKLALAQDPMQSRSSLEDAAERLPVTLKQLRSRPRVSPDAKLNLSFLEIEMEVADPDVWEMFRTEHYKAGSDIKRAHVYIATLKQHGGTPVGMVAVRPQPGRGNNAVTRRHTGWYRESRLVVLKTWQGIGVGCAISDAVAKAYKDAGCIYTSSFLHPRLYTHREQSKLWKPTSANMTGGVSCPAPRRRVHRSPKFSYKFVGECGPASEDGDVLVVSSSDDDDYHGDDGGGEPYGHDEQERHQQNGGESGEERVRRRQPRGEPIALSEQALEGASDEGCGSGEESCHTGHILFVS